MHFEIIQTPGSHPAFAFICLIFTLPHHLPKENTVHKQLIGAVPVGAEVGVISTIVQGLFSILSIIDSNC